MQILIVGIASLRHHQTSSWFQRLSGGRKYSAITAAGAGVDRLESGSGTTSNENDAAGSLNGGIPRRIERAAYRDDDDDDDILSETADGEEDSDRRRRGIRIEGAGATTIRKNDNNNRGTEIRAPVVQPSSLSNDRNEWRDE